MTALVIPAVNDGFLPLGGAEMTDVNLLSWVGVKGREKSKIVVQIELNLC